jgi:hypothetical protein
MQSPSISIFPETLTLPNITKSLTGKRMTTSYPPKITNKEGNKSILNGKILK